MKRLKITRETVHDGQPVKPGDIVEAENLYLVHIGKAVIATSSPSPETAGSTLTVQGVAPSSLYSREQVEGLTERLTEKPEEGAQALPETQEAPEAPEAPEVPEVQKTPKEKHTKPKHRKGK